MNASRFIKVAFYALLAVSAGVALAAFATMSDVGQVMNMPVDWVIRAFVLQNPVAIFISLSTLAIILINWKFRFLKRRPITVYVMAMVFILFMTNIILPYFFLRTHHRDATYISINEANDYLANDTDVFVLEIDGDARAYPRDLMTVPHIAGDIIGGRDVVMTYCILSDLPLAYSAVIDGKPADYTVLAQVDNNLVMGDKSSNAVIQQITGNIGLGGEKVEEFPAQRMPYKSFRELYPQGTVFYPEQDFLERVGVFLMEITTKNQYDGTGPIFETIDLDDDRLPIMERVWGVDINDEQVAFTKSFFKKTPLYNARVGGKDIIVAYFAEYDTVGAFLREIDGATAEVVEIDVFGNTPQGKLERMAIQSGLLWMIWSHWFPGTKVMN